MSLTIGSTLGPYEILSLIGAGGMGEVYRARDTRLDRIVAVKVLPAVLSDRPDLRQRLEREAKTISSLTHQHICTLHDIGETPDGSAFLVMEYLEGESLADRLSGGPLPLKQALRYGSEIAEALASAHSRGIVHRDLKPANVMITKSGVKLLDFGLAKAMGSDAVFDPDSPTQQRDDLTAEGMIVGTLPYMAPEQLEGKVADVRSDIFAFGSTLYEMLSGQRAFQSDSRAGLIGRIMHDDAAPLPSVAPAVPPQVAYVVTHCLMKDPDERWQTARDVAIQLRGIAGASAPSEMLPAIARAPVAWPRLLVATLLVVFGVVIALLAQYLRGPERAADTALTHVSIALSPDGKGLRLGESGLVAISPDGTMVVFPGNLGGVNQLYFRSTSSFETRPIPGSTNATSAFFSPDGKQLAFIANGALRRLHVESSTVETITDSGPSWGGSWGSDGSIVFIPSPEATLHRISAAGGTATPLLNESTDRLSLPAYVPERNLLLAVREVQGQPFDEAEIVAVDLASSTVKVVVRGTAPHYVPATDHLFYVRDGKLWRVGFDPKAVVIRGTPTVITEPVLTYSGSGQAVYDVTSTGDVIYAPFPSGVLGRRIMRVSRNGVAEPLPFPAGEYESAHLSADGRLLGLELIGSNNDAWIGDMERGTLTRVTSSSENLAPILSPDGQQFIIARHNDTTPILTLLRADGSGEPRTLAPAPAPLFPGSWSEDGTVIAVMEAKPSEFDITLVDVASGKATPLFATRFNETQPALSPDGRWIAWSSNETGKQEIYVRALSGNGRRVRISDDGGTEPLWANSGREIFYRNGDTIIAAQITTEPEVGVGALVPLFDFPLTFRDISRGWDITPDDQHFIMIERSAAAESMRTLNVVRSSNR